MKILSIVVPCYNSQEYLSHCIESLLPGGEDLEILIVNDGSTDNTQSIAEKFQKLYPGIIKVFMQENGGHGAAVTTGIRNATGTFIKVVDSDDWVDHDAYQKVMAALRELAVREPPDMVITNYVYEKQGKKKKKVVRYIGVLPVGHTFDWSEVGHFRKGQYMLMHAIIYRTELLRNSSLQLPRHTFYVDNLYAYVPMKDVRTIFYLNVDFYRYFIGREGQSVQEETMIRRIDQQLLVNRMMVTALDLNSIQDKRHREYLFNYLEIVTTISSILLIRSGTEENAKKKKQLWDFIRAHDKRLYNKLRYGLLGQIINLPSAAGRGIALSVYKIANKSVGFN